MDGSEIINRLTRGEYLNTMMAANSNVTALSTKVSPLFQKSFIKIGSHEFPAIFLISGSVGLLIAVFEYCTLQNSVQYAQAYKTNRDNEAESYLLMVV